MTVRYEGPVPQSLRKWCDQHADKVYEVHAGGGYCTDSGFAYDIALRNGWRDGGDYVHSIIEPNVKEALSKLRGVVPCDCRACKNSESHGGVSAAFPISNALKRVPL